MTTPCPHCGQDHGQGWQKLCEYEAKKESSTDMIYKGYFVTYNSKSIPNREYDWDFVHQDYDGPEDGRCGSGASIEDCKKQIDEDSHI